MSTITTQRSPSATVCFRLLLVMSLWQGPVLWGHQHTPESGVSTTHIAQFHGNQSDAWNLSWHWHFSRLDPSGNASSEQSDETRLPFSQIVVNEAGCALALGGTIASVAIEAVRWLPANVPHTGSGVHGFLATYCPAHSPQQVLCRMSC